ncbi:DNA-binding protein [Undibacterium sp. SXout7W]|uniref:DNA-binding protein n=1 Tax=Undibacterium sp. SXout7W TaxID=3413049 RepID=UPI003BF319A7
MKRDLPQSVAQEEALFSSAHAALTFALNFSGQQFGKSAVAALAAPAGGGSGKGLGGLDGAAQAGMIRQELKSCGPLVEALLIARVAPRSKDCHCTHACCSGKIPNDEYTGAIALLCREAMPFVAGSLSHYALRRGVIARYFGEKVKVGELADLCGVTEKTVFNHNEKIIRWLKGENRDSPGAEARAWVTFEETLSRSGMV